eukprot:11214982-Lingulodinium_polyedra.AAC.1
MLAQAGLRLLGDPRPWVAVVGRTLEWASREAPIHGGGAAAAVAPAPRRGSPFWPGVGGAARSR